jgi:hypothetical protein
MRATSRELERVAPCGAEALQDAPSQSDRGHGSVPLREVVDCDSNGARDDERPNDGQHDDERPHAAAPARRGLAERTSKRRSASSISRHLEHVARDPGQVVTV